MYEGQFFGIATTCFNCVEPLPAEAEMKWERPSRGHGPAVCEWFFEEEELESKDEEGAWGQTKPLLLVCSGAVCWQTFHVPWLHLRVLSLWLSSGIKLTLASKRAPTRFPAVCLHHPSWWWRVTTTGRSVVLFALNCLLGIEGKK